MSSIAVMSRTRTKDIHFWLEYKLLTFKIEYHYEES